jgi:hypothetical protein
LCLSFVSAWWIFRGFLHDSVSNSCHGSLNCWVINLKAFRRNQSCPNLSYLEWLDDSEQWNGRKMWKESELHEFQVKKSKKAIPVTGHGGL